MTELRMPLSVLDLAPVSQGSTVGAALHSSIELAGVAERLGYTRHWVAEHHNMPGVASSSPAVLIAHLAAATESIRVGSGGVMLPNHSPLVVAEQFGMLEALHPGRIDLGIGRAPGTDQLTAQALRRTPMTARDDFPEQFLELRGYFSGHLPEDHPFRRITAVPGLGNEPDLWLLGSSDYSAHAAGTLGLPFSFAHHFSAGNTLPALRVYRDAFRPSTRLEYPHAMLGVAVICAPTDDEARYLAGPSALSFLRLRQGRPTAMPSPTEAAEYHYTPHEKEFVRDRVSTQVIGSPETVRRRLDELLDQTRADELMITTMVHSPADRIRSYQLVAETMGLPARRPAASTSA